APDPRGGPPEVAGAFSARPARLPREPVWGRNVVGVHAGDEVATGHVDADIGRSGAALRSRIATQEGGANPAVFPLEAGGDRLAAVLGAIVDDDQLQVAAALRQDRSDRF